MQNIQIYTIGFTKKTAKVFFETLKKSDARRIVDVRLNNISQLAGFAKKLDLIYFLKHLSNMDYIHVPELAPTKEILNDYKKNKISWQSYEESFIKLMEQRSIEDKNIKGLLNQGCLLCSEHEPEHCHRLLIIKYLKKKWKNINFSIKHLY